MLESREWVGGFSSMSARVIISSLETFFFVSFDLVA